MMYKILVLIIGVLILGLNCNPPNSKKKQKGQELISDNIQLKESKRKNTDSTTNKPNYDFLPEQVKSLEDSAQFLSFYFDQFMSFKDSLSEVRFFNMFPSEFNRFLALYGYIDNIDKDNSIYEKGPRPLYFEHHLRIYNKHIKYVDKRIYFNKLTTLAVHGLWDADNVNSLQTILENQMILPDDTLILEILKKKEKKEIIGFWNFYFDGPHPYDDIPKELENKVKDKAMLSIMKKALSDAHKRWEH